MIFAGNVTNDRFDSFYIVKAQYTGQKGGVLMRIQREEKRFIEKCYRLYEQKMYQVAYSILRDSGLAEDAVQEAFLKLMNSDTRFADPKSEDCKRYIITVIKHASIDMYNKKRREQEVFYFTDDSPGMGNGAGPQADRREAEFDLNELISDLPPKYYAVANCLAVKELSVKETAAELGISESAVRKRFERAKLMLKAIHDPYRKGREEYEQGQKIYKSNIS